MIVQRIANLSRRLADVERAPTDETLTDNSGAAGGAIVKITSGGPGDDYIGDVYGEGPDEDATETGVEIVMLGMASGETAVYNRPMLANDIDGVYYVQVPLWQ